MFKNDNLYLEKDILPEFGSIHISKIDYNSVDIFIDELRTERNLSVSSLKKIHRMYQESPKRGKERWCYFQCAKSSHHKNREC